MTYFYSETTTLAHESGAWNQLQPILSDFLAGHITKEDLQDAPSDLGVILCAAAFENDLSLFDRLPETAFVSWCANRNIQAPVDNRLSDLAFYQSELVNLGLISHKSQAAPFNTSRDGVQMFDLSVPALSDESVCYDEDFAQIVLENADKISRYKRSMSDPYQHLEERTIRILGYHMADQRTKRQFIKKFGRALFSELTAKIIIDDNTMPNVKSELFELQDYLGLTNIVISKHTVQFRYPFASEHRLAQFDDPKELQEFLDDTFVHLASENENLGLGHRFNKGAITFEKAALLCKYCDFELVAEEGVYRLKDIQGGNLGDIESKTFESLEAVIHRLENYFLDLDTSVNEYGNIVPVPEEQGSGRFV